MKFSELEKNKKTWDAWESIVNGSYPRLHQEKLSPNRFYNAYIQIYVERDVRSLIHLKDLGLFQQFLTLLAGRDPLRGGLYENLIIRRRRTLIPVEIKSAATFTEGFLKGIERFRGLFKDRAGGGYVLYDGAERFRVRGVSVENLLHPGGPLEPFHLCSLAQANR